MGGDSQETAAAPPLSADQINQLLHDVARDVGARADELSALVDELDGEFKARAAAGDASAAHDLRARFAELSRMKDELSAEFDAKLRDLDAMVKRRLAALAADEDDAAATAAGGVEEGSSAAAAEMLEDRSG